MRAQRPQGRKIRKKRDEKGRGTEGRVMEIQTSAIIILPLARIRDPRESFYHISPDLHFRTNSLQPPDGNTQRESTSTQLCGCADRVTCADPGHIKHVIYFERKRSNSMTYTTARLCHQHSSIRLLHMRGNYGELEYNIFPCETAVDR